jgi:hypothetical protein
LPLTGIDLNWMELDSIGLGFDWNEIGID